MDKYEFKAINLIAETFEKRGVKFEVKDIPGVEMILAGFSIDCGPEVNVMFISHDNDNDVAVRILRLISKTPEARRHRVMEACNILNRRVRHIKFYVDGDGDINVEYDFPEHSPDEGLGDMALEIFIRMMRILDSEYNIFMKALYTDEDLDINHAELMQKLQELRKMMETRMADMGDSDDDEDFGDSELDIETVIPPSDVAC